MYVLTLVDLLHVQSFVFASNRLRDVSAGSAAIIRAADRELLQAMATPGKVIFASGGNALLRFDDLQVARKFAGAYSRHLVDWFPGLEVEIVHTEVSDGQWGQEFNRARRMLESRKLSRRPHAPVLGLSVTAECAETRAVANYRHTHQGNDTETPISASVALRRAGEPATGQAASNGSGSARRIQQPEEDKESEEGQWEKRLLPEEYKKKIHGYYLRFPKELDRLGRTSGETSLIGVVHVDGNGIGKVISNWLTENSTLPESELQEAQKCLSHELDELGRASMMKMIKHICDALRIDGQKEPYRISIHSNALLEGFNLQTDPDTKTLYLPVRPVLLGGDDMTFVCDGRIALDLARIALETFRDTIVSSFNKPIGASAGVAIVKAHFPFAQAYKIAHDLCQSAKTSIYEKYRNSNSDDPRYALDWHIGYATPTESIDALRRRVYSANGLTLTMRPYELGNPNEPFTYSWLDHKVIGDRTASAKSDGPFRCDFWQQRRNKIKELREIIRERPEAVSSALSAWSVTAGIEALPARLHEVQGFDGNRTPLLDAIELLDIHYPLRTG